MVSPQKIYVITSSVKQTFLIKKNFKSRVKERRDKTVYMK